MRKRDDHRKRVRPRETPKGKSPVPEEREGKTLVFFEYFMIVFLFVCLVVVLVKWC